MNYFYHLASFEQLLPECLSEDLMVQTISKSQLPSMAPKFLDPAYFLSLTTFSLSLIMFPTYRPLQFLNHMMLFPISMLCTQFLLLENVSLSFTRLNPSSLSGPGLNVSSPDDTPIAAAVSTLSASPWVSLSSSWTWTPSAVSLPNARKCVSLLKDDFQTDGFGYTLRVEGAYGFISPSIPGCSLNQSLMDEGYECFNILDSWWAQLCIGILIPWQLSCRTDQCCPLSPWLILHSCVSSFLSCPLSPFPTIFPWEHLLINHIDTKSHLRICFWEGKLSVHSNFDPLFHSNTHHLLFFLAWVKAVIIHWVACSIIYCLHHQDYEEIEGRDWIFLFLTIPSI